MGQLQKRLFKLFGGKQGWSFFLFEGMKGSLNEPMAIVLDNEDGQLLFIMIYSSPAFSARKQKEQNSWIKSSLFQHYMNLGE